MGKLVNSDNYHGTLYEIVPKIPSELKIRANIGLEIQIISRGNYAYFYGKIEIALQSSYNYIVIVWLYLNLILFTKNKNTEFSIWNSISSSSKDRLQWPKCHKIIILTYISPLRVNVRVSDYFVQVQDQLALERIHRVCKYNVFRQIILSH